MLGQSPGQNSLGLLEYSQANKNTPRKEKSNTVWVFLGIEDNKDKK